MTPATMSEQRSQRAAFVERHLRGLRRWLRANGCDDASAEDHCQDALLAALHHDIDRWPTRKAWAWLRTTARNFYLMELRRQRRRVTCDLETVERAWQQARGDDDGGDAAKAALRACLDASDARDRELIEQRYAQQASRAEMASAHGIGEAGVKQALRRARTRLRQCMEQRLHGGQQQEM